MMAEDLLKSLGPLALASRLKRLSDNLMQDGIRIYRDSQIDFEPRWFPVYYYLLTAGPSPVTAIARSLGVSHPSVNQVAKELLARELIAAYKDPKDKRKRVLALTSKGKAQRQALETVWQDIQRALQAVIDETNVDFLGDIASIERAINNKSFYHRFQQLQAPDIPGIEVIGYDERYVEDFRRINSDWIVEYFEMEAADQRILDDPEAYVIAPGGEILFAIEQSSGQVVGTCALIPRDEGQVELAKMGILKSMRGRGLGWLLGYKALKLARQGGYKKIYLETNSSLLPAIGLYKRMGFQQMPSPLNTDYQRADVYMALDLSPEGI